MNEPTKEGLERAQKWSDKQWHYTCKIPFLHSLALELDAIRAEERQKAEKLAEALREIKNSNGHERKGDCNSSCYQGCPRCVSEAALAEFERSRA